MKGDSLEAGWVQSFICTLAVVHGRFRDWGASILVEQCIHAVEPGIHIYLLISMCSLIRSMHFTNPL